MRPKLSLTTKVLIFIIVPLSVQLAFLISLYGLQNEAERALQAASKSRRISDKINEIPADIFALHEIYRSLHDMKRTPLDSELTAGKVKQLKTHFRELKSLTKDEPEIHQLVLNADAAVKEALEGFRQIDRRLSSSEPIGPTERLQLVRKFRNTGREEVFQALIEVGKRQQRMAESAPEEQAVYRQKSRDIMITMGAVMVLIGISLSFFLTRTVAARVKSVNDNTYKLASGLPLNPVLEGTDEIAQLDRAFHKMAQELTETARKQSAVIDNARDFICTLDDHGRIMSANPACENLLKLQPEDLLGRHVIDLVASEEASKTLDYLENLRGNISPAPLDVQMRTASGELVDTVWSAHWSHEERSTFCVIHDTTDRRKAERLKQEVMAMITHDLRTPLSVLNNVLIFFESGVAGSFDEKGRRYLAMAKRSAERMSALTNDLLDIEKIKSGTMKLDIETINLSHCFEECQSVCTGYAEEMAVKLEFHSCDIDIEADEKRLDRVLTNLVSNAVKFSPKEKTVCVSAAKLKDTVRIKVEDEGPGIPEDMRLNIFERFQQVDGAVQKGKTGSGLGLAICKAIVELHGGKIWVEGKTQGSIFVVELPVQQDRQE